MLKTKIQEEDLTCFDICPMCALLNVPLKTRSNYPLSLTSDCFTFRFQAIVKKWHAVRSDGLLMCFLGTQRNHKY